MKINKIITYSLAANVFIFGFGFFGRLSLNNHEYIKAEERDKGLKIIVQNAKAKTCQRINANILFSVGDLLPDLKTKTKTILLKESAETAADIFSASCIWNIKTQQLSLVGDKGGSKKILQTYSYDEVVKKSFEQEEQ